MGARCTSPPTTSTAYQGATPPAHSATSTCPEERDAPVAGGFANNPSASITNAAGLPLDKSRSAKAAVSRAFRKPRGSEGIKVKI
jgi:hypothetical protein